MVKIAKCNVPRKVKDGGPDHSRPVEHSMFAIIESTKGSDMAITLLFISLIVRVDSVIIIIFSLA